MSSSILFVHGMFLNPKSWEHWVPFFEDRDFLCGAPAWPFHEGEPGELRRDIPAGLGRLSLATVVERYAEIVSAEAEPPILIGHSMGGLIVQLLIARGLGSAGVCISSVAPNAMLSFDWSFFKNSVSIMNPLKGNDPYIMTEEGFRESFCNTMTEDEAARAYARYAVHESRNVMRDSVGKAGSLDLDKPHRPLLFLAGDQDQIIPSSLNKKNAEAYTDSSGIADFVEFKGRGHFIYGQPGWEEIAADINGWVNHRVRAHTFVD
ncbi:MAG TPA: alpha/beta hydrolase [Opitutaceae bacterium]|nr:alpha/beta hydrolase [Opitutaceae bacterium]